MSLRVRLVLTVLGLLVLGLGVAVGATFGAMQDWRNDQNDDVLTQTGRRLAADLGTLETDADALWQAAAEVGDMPSFFQIRAADGSVVRTVDFRGRPPLSSPLPAEMWPDNPTPANPDGESFHRLSPHWLVRTAALSDGRMLLVGMRTELSDELISRTAVAATTSSVAALLAVALLAWRAVRRGMRPLDEVADTAAAIGSGELSRRLRHANRRTEVGRLGLALNAMLGQIEEAFNKRRESEQRLRRFVADASHELRTPVATIRGYAELFRRGAAQRPDDLAKVMSRIESEAQRMGCLVDELLLLARLDQGLPLERDPVDLGELAVDAVADARAVATDRTLTLRFDGPVVVLGDAARLRQVMANLLSNVLSHTPDGTSAEVRVHTDDGHGVIEVADNGPGLSAEDADRVFERFYRADSARSRPRSGRDGSGLGLSIVATVAAAHGGEVAIDTSPGKGATFRVRLPLHQ